MNIQPVIDSDAEKAVAKALDSIGDLGTLPEITLKIIETVEDPRSTARDLHEIVTHDLALSARILRVVNSAFYGLPGQVASIDRAIVMLGLNAVKNIKPKGTNAVHNLLMGCCLVFESSTRPNRPSDGDQQRDAIIDQPPTVGQHPTARFYTARPRWNAADN